MSDILQQEFQNRKGEIDCYFALLTIIEAGSCSVTSVSLDGKTHICEVDDDLSTILKANCFILLYNLIESTVRKSIEMILETLYNERVSFKSLSIKLKQIWISQHILPLKKGIDAITYDKIHNLMFDMADHIVNEHIMRLEADCIRISGNIDAKEIRSIANQIGFESPENGRDLLTIKVKRNHLAHGEKSFIEVGRDYSINDLIAFKDRTYAHLEDVIQKITTYISNKNYLKA